MSSYRQILYHLVFRTKDSAPTLPLNCSDELYRYLWGIVKNKQGVLYRVNGMEEHIHLLTDLHPSVALADFLRDLKTSSSLWLKNHPRFPAFNGWAEGYAALTYAYRDKDMLINYIKNQREHHRTEAFLEERCPWVPLRFTHGYSSSAPSGLLCRWHSEYRIVPMTMRHFPVPKAQIAPVGAIVSLTL